MCSGTAVMATEKEHGRKRCKHGGDDELPEVSLFLFLLFQVSRMDQEVSWAQAPSFLVEENQVELSND